MTPKPSLLFVGSQIAIGGAQKALLTTAEWFHNAGYPVQAAYYHGDERLLAEWQARYPFSITNLRGYQKPASAMRQAALLAGGSRRLWKLMRQHHFDAIFTYTHHSNLTALPLARLAGIPIRVGSHHGVILDFPDWMDKLHTNMVNSNTVTHFVTVSEKVKQQSMEAGINPAKIAVIHNGISIRAPRPEQVEATRAALQLTGRGPLLLSAGRLTEQKSHITLLQALPVLRQRFPDLTLLLAGDGPLRATLEAEVRQLDITSSVRFLGFRGDIPELMALADIFVLPSVSEGLPFVILEAMGLGKPVVSTRVAGIGEVIEDGTNGLLIASADPQAIAEAVTRVLADPDRAAAMGTAARKTVQEGFTIDVMCRQYEALLHTPTSTEAA